jgi:hypothetical protein
MKEYTTQETFKKVFSNELDYWEYRVVEDALKVARMEYVNSRSEHNYKLVSRDGDADDLKRSEELIRSYTNEIARIDKILGKLGTDEWL